MNQKNINKAMGDIDEAASAVQVPGAAKDPGDNIGSIDDAPHGGINSTVDVAPEASGTAASYVDNSFMDDVAQYVKGDQKELFRIRNQAYNAPTPNADNVPPLLGRQDSDPQGG